MRRIVQITVVALLVSCGIARAGPILLGTISNTWHGTDPSVVEEYLAGDRLLYQVVGLLRRGDLFEEDRVTVRLDGPPVTVDQSITGSDDPDFALIAELLTDGVSLGDPTGLGLQEISVLGLIGTEEIIDVHVPRISEFDLLGYQVERIDRHVTFSITTPGGDPTALGTDFHIGGVYEFWGSVIPEPTTLALLALGLLPLLRRRRLSSTCRFPMSNRIIGTPPNANPNNLDGGFTMRSALYYSILLGVSGATVHAAPVLLATASGEQEVRIPWLVDAISMNSFLRYQRATKSAIETYDLFDEETVLVWRDNPPVRVASFIESSMEDPEFARFVEFLTDGEDQFLLFFDPVVGLLSGGLEDDFLDLRVSGVLDPDLNGYTIQRIGREITYALTTVDGASSTDVLVSGTFEIYGQVIPDPATVTLLAGGSLVVLQRRKNRKCHRVRTTPGQPR